MKKGSTSQAGKGLTWSEGRELVVRIKTLEGRAASKGNFICESRKSPSAKGRKEKSYSIIEN